MNDERRKKLQRAAAHMSEAISFIEEVKGEEEETLEIMPENMQSGEKGEKIQGAIEALGDAVEAIEQASDSLSSAME